MFMLNIEPYAKPPRLKYLWSSAIFGVQWGFQSAAKILNDTTYCELTVVPQVFILLTIYPSVGANVMNPMRYPIFNITAYIWVLSDTFSLQWDIPIPSLIPFLGTARFALPKMKPVCFPCSNICMILTFKLYEEALFNSTGWECKAATKSNFNQR